MIRGQCEHPDGCNKLGRLFTSTHPDTGRLIRVCENCARRLEEMPGREAVTDLEYRQRQAEVSRARR